MMNRLILRLLRRYVSWGQLAGFFLANLFGMFIVLLSWQCYNDILPVFTQGDSFMKQNYLVVGKRVSSFQTLQGETPRFSAAEIADFAQQPFVKSLGRFTPAQYDVYATVGNAEIGLSLSTEMFFESLPDQYVDADLSRWHYDGSSDTIPLVLPKNYLNLYNFGFAGTRGLPALSEGLVSMIHLKFSLRGTMGERIMYGKVVDFSNRLNTILVPQTFMEEANALLAPDREPLSSRVILEVNRPADERIATYLSSRGYEEEGGAADAGRMSYFLRLIFGIVLAVGLIICVLAFYVLLLSIYLLLQKNTEKIDNLFLLGYSVTNVSLPFHLLSWGVNLLVLLLSISLVKVAQTYYIGEIGEVYPQLELSGIRAALFLGSLLFLLVSLLNYFAIQRQIKRIWLMHRIG